MTANWAGCVIPEDLHYDTFNDVWVRIEGEIATLGMTDVAQTRCGRLVQLSWKRPGAAVRRGRPLSVIESAKWVGPFVSPLSGVVVAHNRDAFESDVAIANRDPYGEGWLYRVELSDPSELDDLVSAEIAFEHYRKVIDENGIRCFRCEQ